MVSEFYSNFYVLSYICFLSLIKLERWLAKVMFVPSSTLTAALKTLPHGLGLGSRIAPPYLTATNKHTPSYTSHRVPLDWEKNPA